MRASVGDIIGDPSKPLAVQAANVIRHEHFGKLSGELKVKLLFAFQREVRLPEPAFSGSVIREAEETVYGQQICCPL